MYVQLCCEQTHKFSARQRSKFISTTPTNAINIPGAVILMDRPDPSIKANCLAAVHDYKSSDGIHKFLASLKVFANGSTLAAYSFSKISSRADRHSAELEAAMSATELPNWPRRSNPC